MRDEDGRRSILRRRARFVAAALASAGVAATASTTTRGAPDSSVSDATGADAAPDGGDEPVAATVCLCACKAVGTR